MDNNFIFLSLITDACKNISVLRTVLFIKKLLNIVFILVPIGLIVMLSLDFAKNVISGKEDEVKKNLNIAIKRLIFVVLLFFVPTIVKFSINLLGDFGSDYTTCLKVTKDSINYQISLNKTECTDNGYEWDESTSECMVKSIPPTVNNVITNNKKIVVDSSKSSESVVDKMDSLFKEYNNRLKSDRKSGKHWIYTNSGKYGALNTTFEKSASKLGCNCATSTNWVLKDIGAIKSNTMFYGDKNGKLKSNNLNDLKRNTKIYHYGSKTVKQSISEGKIVPGDIICSSGHTFTYMGDYVFDTGRGTDGKYIGKKYGNRSEYSSDFEFHNWIMKKGTNTYNYDVNMKAYNVIRVKKSFKVK